MIVVIGCLTATITTAAVTSHVPACISTGATKPATGRSFADHFKDLFNYRPLGACAQAAPQFHIGVDGLYTRLLCR